MDLRVVRRIHFSQGFPLGRRPPFMKLRPIALLAPLWVACAAPLAQEDAYPPLRQCLPPQTQDWAAPSPSGPVLVGTVWHPDGSPLAGVLVRPHAGFATRFPGTPTRTDVHGRFRLDPVYGSLMAEDGIPDAILYVGICVGETQHGGNPAEFLPWQDFRVSNQPGVVKHVTFTFDPASVE